MSCRCTQEASRAEERVSRTTVSPPRCKKEKSKNADPGQFARGGRSAGIRTLGLRILSRRSQADHFAQCAKPRSFADLLRCMGGKFCFKNRIPGFEKRVIRLGMHGHRAADVEKRVQGDCTCIRRSLSVSMRGERRIKGFFVVSVLHHATGRLGKPSMKAFAPSST